MASGPRPRADTAAHISPTRSPAVRVLKSTELLRGDREVVIEHDGRHYRLRQTSNGKLILTK